MKDKLGVELQPGQIVAYSFYTGGMDLGVISAIKPEGQKFIKIASVMGYYDEKNKKPSFVAAGVKYGIRTTAIGYSANIVVLSIDSMVTDNAAKQILLALHHKINSDICQQIP